MTDLSHFVSQPERHDTRYIAVSISSRGGRTNPNMQSWTFSLYVDCSLTICVNKLLMSVSVSQTHTALTVTLRLRPDSAKPLCGIIFRQGGKRRAPHLHKLNAQITIRQLASWRVAQSPTLLCLRSLSEGTGFPLHSHSLKQSRAQGKEFWTDKVLAPNSRQPYWDIFCGTAFKQKVCVL